MAATTYPKFHTYKHKPFSFMIENSDEGQRVNVNATPEEGFMYIRLLCLYPAASSDTLIGSVVERKISTKDRKKPQNFEALSYCWGPVPKDNSEWRTISIVDSHNDEYSIYAIRPNLAAALRRLRDEESKFRYLWIDAICIDQSNNSEKSQQIPLMDKIFQSATRVCIWLGDDKKNEVAALALKHISRIIELEGFENLIKPTFTDDWAALASLMKREWFSRRWVVQEIAYARQAKVYWDDQSIDWKDLADAVSLFGSKAPEIAELFKQDPKYNHRADFLGDVEALSANRLVQTIGKVFRKADSEQHVERLLSLEALISELSAFNASRPHDIIYAILSLAKDTITSTTQPQPLQHSAPKRRHSTANVSRPASQQVDMSAFPNGIARLGESMNTLGEHALAPTQEPQSDEYFDLLSDVSETSVERIKQFGYGDDKIRAAKERLICHIEACPRPFNYDIMIDGLGLREEEQRNSLVIGRRFWNPTSVSWMERGDRGLAALTLKLLQHERSLNKLATDFTFKLHSRVQFKKFHVDYQKKFYEVCKDFINFTIRSTRSLDMLCRPWAPDKEDLPKEDQEAHDLPSWICPLSKSPFLPRPDGNFSRVNADLLVGMPNTGGTVYKTSASTDPEQYFFGGPGNRRLFVAGILVDKIRSAATEAVEGNIPSSWLPLGGWPDTTKPPPESFWRTIVADRNEKGQNPPSYYQRACQYAFRQRTNRGSLNTERLINAKISQVMTEYIKRVQAVVWMRKLIRTENSDNMDHLYPPPSRSMTGADLSPWGTYTPNAADMRPATYGRPLVNGDLSHSQPNEGRLGLVPHTAREEDFICMLRGCSVPIVVRILDISQAASDIETQEQLGKLKVQAAGKKWNHVVCRIVGECYIHGIMDGEIFKMREEQNLQDSIFEII